MDEQVIVWFKVGKTKNTSVGTKRGIRIKKLESTMGECSPLSYFTKETLMFYGTKEYQIDLEGKVEGEGEERPAKKEETGKEL